ncbi:MAG: 5-formyltetrahydrofolate cyclo-ligase [Flammeovirgaceae bacterium]|nr:5-formyltetrahydrofolate cyclo-ligase [Flammeovirgaceae bacterium]MBE62199.1 5-formyltetrahydrofolate cyclo-ligase [Flammeovirgaceae bacterium]HCX20303.1 5-formyltetrahydrofolate cyclo-ligase [Cytophagales bacterium]|tara:strand:+ start:65 stop:646 length:582 start_codon:yes stop_codon:yes gene_type:complete
MSDAKAKLRKGILFNRRLLAKEIFDERNQAVINSVIQFIQNHSKRCVHCFLPIERNNEVNTWPLVEQLVDAKIKVVLSSTDFENQTMTHYWHKESLSFENDRFGIPTPINGQFADTSEIDLVIIPLLAADKKGNRIGYGKGYYDRLLTEMRSDVLKIGVTLGPAFDHFTFAEPHDINLDYLITPFEVIMCKEN